MNTLRYLIAATLAITGLTTATAHAETRRPSLTPTASPMPTQFQAERTIEITPQTQWVNVKRLEVVQFVNNAGSGPKSFTWQFDARSVRPFSLSDIAPAGFVQQPVTVYVAPSRLSR